MTDSEKLIDKIRKLHAKSQGTENEAEAMIFSQKVQALLAQNNLDMADLNQSDIEEIVERIQESVDTNKWRIQLFSSVARFYFCGVYIRQRSEMSASGNVLRRKDIVYVGKAHNLEVASSMGDYLEKTVLRLAKEYSKERKLRLQFESGCGTRISDRLHSMTKEMQNENSLEYAGSGLPVLYKNELGLVEDFLSDMNLVNMKSKASKLTQASLDGRKAGNSVHLGGQLSGAASSRLLG